jgi:hypothetical protein
MHPVTTAPSLEVENESIKLLEEAWISAQSKICWKVLEALEALEPDPIDTYHYANYFPISSTTSISSLLNKQCTRIVDLPLHRTLLSQNRSHELKH